MAAKAKIIKRTRKPRMSAKIITIFTCVLILFILAKVGVKNYNYNLSKQVRDKQQQVSDLQEDIATMKNEIHMLQNRERVLGMVEKEGIESNQDQVVVMGKDAQ